MESVIPGKSYNIGNVGQDARVQQGEHLTWIDAAGLIPNSNTLLQQFKNLFEQISTDNSLDDVTRSISLKKTEAVVKGLSHAQASPTDLHNALVDAKSWFSDKSSGIWNQLNNILRSDTAQKTIGTITENSIMGAITGIIGGM